ncbi:uncharacterized protein LOC121379957 [Gigantopelta aegis]|uniref:uncharacterized protein LOC121379957 n=1 Tax=Gigantopelta aegis TaxID=1735272 RepID=UPI001B888974|nr:uncharacterized protein LOC121379957 [Gigantopelta aegis]
MSAAKPTDKRFRRMLSEIARELGEDDVNELSFLFRDVLKKKHETKNVMDLFNILIDGKIIHVDDVCSIVKALDLMQKNLLLEKIEFLYKEHTMPVPMIRSHIREFTVLLYNTGCNLTEDDITRVMFEQEIKGDKQEQVKKNRWKLFSILLAENILSEGDDSSIENVFGPRTTESPPTEGASFKPLTDHLDSGSAGTLQPDNLPSIASSSIPVDEQLSSPFSKMDVKENVENPASDQHTSTHPAGHPSGDSQAIDQHASTHPAGHPSGDSQASDQHASTHPAGHPSGDGQAIGEPLCEGGADLNANTYVLLVAATGKTEKQTNIFDNDLEEMKKLFMNKKYIGVRSENIYTVSGKHTKASKMKKTLLKTVDEIASTIENNNTYFVFCYVGHHSKEREIGIGGEKHVISEIELKKALRKIDATYMLFILNTCFSESMDMGAKGSVVELPPLEYPIVLWDLWDDADLGAKGANTLRVMQWCSSGRNQTSFVHGKSKLSYFTSAIITAVEKKCNHSMCDICEHFKSGTQNDSFISLKKLHECVRDHVKKDKPCQEPELLPLNAVEDEHKMASFPPFAKKTW